MLYFRNCKEYRACSGASYKYDTRIKDLIRIELYQRRKVALVFAISISEDIYLLVFLLQGTGAENCSYIIIIGVITHH